MAVRSPFGFWPIWTELGCPARNTTSHSLMPSATAVPSNASVPAAGAAASVADAPGADAPGAMGPVGAVGTAGAAAATTCVAGGGDGQAPLLLTRSFAVIGRWRCLLSYSSENV